MPRYENMNLLSKKNDFLEKPLTFHFKDENKLNILGKIGFTINIPVYNYFEL